MVIYIHINTKINIFNNKNTFFIALFFMTLILVFLLYMYYLVKAIF